jgi:Domain of unknown function (DUF4397)
MKKVNIPTFLLLIAGAIFLPSCKKEKKEPPITVGYISFHNAALLLPRAGNVLIDDKKVNNANFLGYLNSITGNFVGAEQGSRTIAFKDSSASATTDWVSRTATIESNKAISVFTYDTLNAATGKIKMLVLKTDLTPPTPGSSKVRFLHLSPDAPAVDVALLRVNDARTAYRDSVVINNVSYVGLSTPNETTLSVLSTIPSGLYHIRVRRTGTFTNAVSVGTSFTTGQSIIEGKNYSILARGFLTNTGVGRSSTTALGATVILHNP